MRKIKFQLVTVIICIIVAFLVTIKLGKQNAKPEAVLVPMAVNQLPDIQKALNKIKLEDTIISGIEQKFELITMEVDLQQDMTWNDSWGSFDVFRKEQLIRYYGKGIYTTDLSLIDPDETVFNHNSKIITIKVPKPVIKTIYINEDKTEFQATQTGWLRFGDIKITPSDSQIITMQVEKLMKEEMSKKELYEQAEDFTKSSVTEIFDKLLTGTRNDDYIINTELI